MFGVESPLRRCSYLRAFEVMPVPDFDHNGVLPPHLGSPTRRELLSPYLVSALELCEKLGTSAERCEILLGLLELRRTLRILQFTDCFQWIDGSFMENCEELRKRPPGDVDVVTFARYPKIPVDRALGTIIRDHGDCKSRYHVDHFIVGLEWPQAYVVEHTRYWARLFSHSRDGVWKGMVRLELGRQEDDDSAVRALATKTHARLPLPTPPTS